jgi:hypothetical protein
MSNYPKDLGNNRWIVEVRTQGGSDELYIELPPSALNQMGWDAGDKIEWIQQKDGSYMLMKANDEQD